MKLLRNGAFLMAVTVTTLVAVYMGLVANRAVLLLTTDELPAQILGGGLLVLPAIGAWWVIKEWAHGTVVQRMSNQLEAEDALPVLEGERMPSGRLTEEAAAVNFEIASREVELRPHDWRAWFHAAAAYEAARDRTAARRTLRHAADLFKAERARQRLGEQPAEE